MRKRLIAAAALTPLIAAAGGGWAHAETVLSGSPPFSTSKAGDDVKNASGTTLTGSSTAPVIITVDSNKGANNEGAITSTDVDGSAGIVVNSGVTGFVRTTGSISIIDSYTRTDTDSDGDLDGAFATGTGRYGIHVLAGGTFTGTGTALTTGGPPVAILNAIGGSILVEGNSSYGILTESDIVGSVDSLGSIAMNGDNGGGLAVKGNVTGDVRAGAVTVRGLGSTGVTVDGDVGGKVNISGSVTTSGYSFTTRPAATSITALDADDIGQGGVALRVAGNVAGGVILSAPPTASTTVTDVDGDGVPDSSQGVGVVSSAGTSPAILLGSTTRDIVLGNVGTTTDTSYGFINQGQILANGVYDNFDAVAVVIGAGKSVSLTGGISMLGTASALQAAAYEANATGVSLQSGASVAALRNDGTISSVVTTTNAADQSRALSVESGASLTSIQNSGNIVAAITGLTGITRAITDSSGTLSTINNTGVISAQIAPAQGVTGTITGVTIAIDAASGTKGLAITQSQSTVTDAAAPRITGDVYFGSGDDSLTVSAGSVVGALSFGAGADTLTISGANTVVAGSLRDDGLGGLAVAVNSGKLSLTNAEEIKGSTLNLGATSSLLVAASPTTTTKDASNPFAVTHLEVADATIAGGAQIGLTLQGLLINPSKLTVISASNSMTSTGALGTTLLENAPYLYQVTSSVDTKAREVYLNVSRRSTTDMGFNRAETSAYDAIFNAIASDTGIQGALLAQTSQSGLTALYDQLLPDQGQGVFTTLDSSINSVSRLVAERPDPETRAGGDSLWLQEVNERTHRDAGQSLGSEGRALGIVGGYESLSPSAGAVGLTLAYYNVQDSDSAAAVNENVIGSLVEGGVYYRFTPGNFRFMARAAGGYAWFNSTRRFVYPGVVRQAEASWTASFADASASAAYEARMGRYYARPDVSIDWVYVSEGAQTETGGGTGFNLAVDSRKSDRLTASAMLTLGAQYGRTSWLRPEFRVGYRSILSGQVGATVARFTGTTGGPFTLLSDDTSGGWLLVGFSLKGGTELSYAALEGDAELRDGEQRYNIRIAGRALF